MQLNGLRYFVALAREQHFARAAAACNVTQPTLSAGIAALEEQLGTRLVSRDRRFIALTAEGAAALPWAQRTLAGLEGLAQAVGGTQGPLTGELRLGAIPASMPIAGAFVRAMRAREPGLTLTVRSLTSREIARAIAAFELDAGITYLDHEPPAEMIDVALYDERYMFATRDDPRDAVRWDELAALPLCLLHQGMQNRRILDAHLGRRGIVLHPLATADSYVALLAMVATGGCHSIVPERYRDLIAGGAVRLLPFAEPLPPSRIGLIVAQRTPMVPLAAAALGIARSIAADELPPL